MVCDTRPSWVLQTLQAFSHLLELPQGWDSYGAPPIQPSYIQAALSLLLGVMRDNTPVPSVMPTSRGGVQLEWHMRDVDLEIEFETPSRIQGFFEDRRTGESWQADLSADVSPFVRAISTLSERA